MKYLSKNVAKYLTVELFNDSFNVKDELIITNSTILTIPTNAVLTIEFDAIVVIDGSVINNGTILVKNPQTYEALKSIGGRIELIDNTNN